MRTTRRCRDGEFAVEIGAICKSAIGIRREVKGIWEWTRLKCGDDAPLVPPAWRAAGATAFARRSVRRDGVRGSEGMCAAAISGDGAEFTRRVGDLQPQGHLNALLSAAATADASRPGSSLTVLALSAISMANPQDVVRGALNKNCTCSRRSADIAALPVGWRRDAALCAGGTLHDACELAAFPVDAQDSVHDAMTCDGNVQVTRIGEPPGDRGPQAPRASAGTPGCDVKRTHHGAQICSGFAAERCGEDGRTS